MNTTPNHVALILDGNRRWAKEHGKLPVQGHRYGALAIEKIIKKLQKEGVHTTTIWIFSTENWKRDKSQVEGLFNLFNEFIDTYYQEALKNKMKMVHLGRKDHFSKDFLAKVQKLEKDTAHFTDFTLNICLDYGGNDEIVRAVQKMIVQGVNPDEITIENFNLYLDTAGQKYPNPDIVIRTGGEIRMSGFMTWQSAYSELFFVDTYLPDLNEGHIDDILSQYAQRMRRFGK